jgi:hypothetical protein
MNEADRYTQEFAAQALESLLNILDDARGRGGC